MKTINRLALLLVGLVFLGAGAAGLGRAVGWPHGVWGDRQAIVFSANRLTEFTQNQWLAPLAVGVAAAAAAGALWLLFANVAPRSRILQVSRHRDGNTYIRTSDLLEQFRVALRAEAQIPDVRASMVGRAGRPKINLWLSLNPSDGPHRIAMSLHTGAIARFRKAVSDPDLPVAVHLRFKSEAAIPAKEKRRSRHRVDNARTASARAGSTRVRPSRVDPAPVAARRKLL